MTRDEELLRALDDLVVALNENTERNRLAIERTENIKRLRAQGEPWSAIVTDRPGPLIVELLSKNLAALTTAGSRLRRLEARALHEEGLSMERIGTLFGVTRQRISELLRQPANGGSQVS